MATPEEEQGQQMLRRLGALFNGGVPTKEEFVNAFKNVVDFVTRMDQRLAEQFRVVAGNLKKLSDEIAADKNKAIADMKGKLDELFVGDRLKKIEGDLHSSVHTKFSEKSQQIDEKVSQLKDGPPGAPGAAGENGSPDTPEEVRDKLESLEGDNRLPVSAIKGLDEYMKKNKNVMLVPVGAGGGGKIVKSYDLSASLDGSTRAFSIPAFWRVISVHLSSFPNILRPTTDYVADATAYNITFTSEVPDNSLAAGQTLIIVYSEQ